MNQQTEHFHGSDLEKIEAVYGIKSDQITSFSANVNPLGVSMLLRKTLAEKIDVITAYPDREYTKLRKSIADYAGCDYTRVVVGSGSTELISLMMKIKTPANALIIAPTYSEYEHEIALIGGNSFYYPLKESDGFQLNLEDLQMHLNDSIDLLVLCNPNNPTSTSVPKMVLRSLLDVCLQHNIFVMIDETYVEFTQDYENITAVPLTSYYSNLVILRGISKFFAAPGLRLGYAITGNKDLIAELTSRQNPWTINSLAAVAGEIMFSDHDYIAQTKELIFSERKRMTEMLSQMEGIKVYEPTANFILVKIVKESITSKLLFENAIRRGLMIRDCSTFPFLGDKYIRFCFMTPDKNDELLECIKETLEQ